MRYTAFFEAICGPDRTVFELFHGRFEEIGRYSLDIQVRFAEKRDLSYPKKQLFLNQVKGWYLRTGIKAKASFRWFV
jgi:hypothetical protein